MNCILFLIICFFFFIQINLQTIDESTCRSYYPYFSKITRSNPQDSQYVFIINKLCLQNVQAYVVILMNKLNSSSFDLSIIDACGKEIKKVKSSSQLMIKSTSDDENGINIEFLYIEGGPNNQQKKGIENFQYSAQTILKANLENCNESRLKYCNFFYDYSLIPKDNIMKGFNLNENSIIFNYDVFQIFNYLPLLYQLNSRCHFTSQCGNSEIDLTKTGEKISFTIPSKNQMKEGDGCYYDLKLNDNYFALEIQNMFSNYFNISYTTFTKDLVPVNIQPNIVQTDTESNGFAYIFMPPSSMRLYIRAITNVPTNTLTFTFYVFGNSKETSYVKENQYQFLIIIILLIVF